MAYNAQIFQCQAYRRPYLIFLPIIHFKINCKRMTDKQETVDPFEFGFPRTNLGELQSIITKPANGLFMLPSDSYNEVFDGIFIGDSSSALNEKQLQTLGITHLLNAAQGTDFWHVNTGPEDYSESGIIFHGVPAMDSFQFELNRYFDEACDFIGKAVGTKKSGKLDGRIFVHCKEGVSRSASLVLAYLVRDQEMQLTDAVKLVRSKREIIPNEGFLLQLIDFSLKLGRA